MKLKDKEKIYQKHYAVKGNVVEIAAYCIMPTHIHLILKQLKNNGISTYMGNVLNSYTRYFNNKTKRGGPLWESRFKNVEVESDEQLLHLTRYIHLNPSTANLAEYPEDWDFSSYREFMGGIEEKAKLCNYDELLNIKPYEYKKFVSSRINCQRDLARIKDLCME